METNTKTPHQQQLPYEDDDIDLIALAKTLWEGRKVVVKITLAFMGIGLFVALTTPAEYTSSVVVKPILSDSKANIGGSLGGLAAMAGINFGGANSVAEIHPTLYPKIVESYSFQKQLMESTIYVKELDLKVSFEKYYAEFHRLSVLEYIQKYTLGLPGVILSSLKGKEKGAVYAENEFQAISKKDKDMMLLIEKQLKVSVDEEHGFVSISAIMPDRLQAAQIALNAEIILQRKVINHKLKKAKEDLDFIQERYNEKKNAFEKAQLNLAKYRDANKNVNTASALTEVERLESEYQLAFSVYSELAKRVETQKIQVIENTPVFTILQDAVVPLEKSNTSRVVVLILWTLLGIFIGIVTIFSKEFISNIREKWENSF